MNKIIKAKYFNGNNAAGESVKIEILEKSLEIDFTETHNTVALSPEKLKNIEYFPESIVIDFNRSKGRLSGKLIVDDPQGMEDLKNFIKQRSSEDHSFLSMMFNPEESSLLRVIGVTVPLISIFIGLFFLIIFNVYRIIPHQVDRSLGEIAYNQLMAGSEKCENKTLNRALTDMAKRLAPENDQYDIRVTIVKSDIINAVSLPGGHIIFFSKLISESETPEEVAGVMAHELAHVYKRHGIQQVVRVSGMTLVAALVTGGTFEGLESFETVAEAGSMLVLLKYSRSFETEADETALELMKNSGVSHAGLISFFKRLYSSSMMDLFNDEENLEDESISEDETDLDEASSEGNPDAEDSADASLHDSASADEEYTDEDLISVGDDYNVNVNSEKVQDHLEEWISTHPPDEKRIENLEKLSSEFKYAVTPVYRTDNWKKIRSLCDDE